MKKNSLGMIKLLSFVYRRLYPIRKFKIQIWLYGIFKLLTTVFPLLYSFVIAKLIDTIIHVVNTSGSFDEVLPFLIYIGILAIVEVIIHNGYGLMDALVYLWVPYIEDIAFLSKYLEIEPQAYEDPKFVNEKNTMAWNSWNVQDSVVRAFELIASLLTAVISFTAILNLQPMFSVLAVISVIPAGYITAKYGKKVWNIWNSNGEEKTKYSAYRGSFWGVNFEQFQEIFIFGYGKYLFERARAINEKFTKKLEKNNTERQLSLSVAALWKNILAVAVVAYSIKMVLDGNLTVGLLTFVIATYNNFNHNISQVIYHYAYLVGNKPVLEIFYNIQNRKNKIVSGSNVLPECTSGIDIEFRNVWFKYPKTDKWIFRDLSFTISSDEDVAIVGKNGAGKTTLIKILLRIYDVDKGDVLVNGINVKDLDMDSYYKVVGVLAQSFNKLGITAKDNIHIGDVFKNNFRGIKEAAKLADVHDTLEKLPSGYNTYLTKDVTGGIQLSGGQWQKLAIARAFYRNTKLLILDEPTSAIDAISEEKIFDNIRTNAENQTTLIISHRFSTVKKAQKIIVIDNGEIVEEGNHRELMANKKLYSEMYLKQSA